MKKIIALLIVACSLNVHAAAGTDYTVPYANDELFHVFGDKPGLVKLVDDFHDNLMRDPRTRPFFENVEQDFLKEKLVEQFCEVLGGPCVYNGPLMSKIHAQRGIGKTEFNALVQALQLAMDKNGIPFPAQNKLLAKLAPMHRDVVTKQ